MNKQLTLLILILSISWNCNESSFSSSASLADYVNPFIGTGGHGHTYPGATVPFGLVQLSPDTRLEGWDGCSGYHYTDSRIYGFSHTHLSGTGVSDHGDILLMPQPSAPFDGELANVPKTNFNNGYPDREGYNSEFQKSSEAAAPGHYAVHLDKPNVDVELTATEHVGFHKYTYKNLPSGKSTGTILLDLTHRDEVMESAIRMVSLTEIEGYRISTAWAKKQRVYFVAQFSQPILGYNLDSFQVDIKPQLFENQYIKTAFHFELPANGEVQVKVGISAVDIDGARKNLNEEVPHWDFTKVKNQATEKWNQELSKIEVEAQSDDDKTIFYSALYHTMVAPNLFTDVDGRYRGHDDEIHEATDHKQYTVFSLWDTYRATHPLYTIIDQKRTLDFIHTFLKIYDESGRLPFWELWGNETDCMIGYHAVSVIADAYAKGIRGFDEQKALEAMISFAEEAKYGKEHYIAHGCISSELEHESVSKTLEYAYNDWCIARYAQALGKEEIHKKFYLRSQNWLNLFDPESKFFRAKNRQFWQTPFDPYEVNFHFTEANAWQYGYYVPHDLESFIEVHGGNENFEKYLDAIFNASPKTTGREQGDITGLLGQYAHGNEPSHHIGYLYNYIGKPWKTQEIIAQITDEMYKNDPHGYEGNEDCGQMSAWYVLSAMGIYQVAPGRPTYDIGTPRMKQSTIHLENGKTFKINASRLSANNKYIQSASLNGNELPYLTIDHQQILEGGELTLEMGGTPNKNWRMPTKMDAEADLQLVSLPAVSKGERVFMNQTEIELNTASTNAEILYSLDGSPPSIKYEQPIKISRSTKLKAKSKTPFGESQVIETALYKIPKNREINLATSYAPQYAAGGDKALIDFITGNNDYRTGEWQGYEGVDLDATVDLGKTQFVQSVSINFLQDQNSWIFFPTDVEFYGSTDGTNFKRIDQVENKIGWKKDQETLIEDYTGDFQRQVRYIRVVGRNQGDCPKGHKSEGGKCWVFADEIRIL